MANFCTILSRTVLYWTYVILIYIWEEKNEDKQSAMAAINENRLHKFFNLMERMNNRYNENYNYELSEGIINRPSDDVIMSFLGELGLNIEDDSVETNELM